MALDYTLKRGEIGSVMTATLSDATGAVNLSGGTVTFTASKRGTDTIDHVACVIAADQSANKGQITYEFDATTANIAAGEYSGEFRFTNAGGDVYFFPKSKNAARTYFRMIVQDSL